MGCYEGGRVYWKKKVWIPQPLPLCSIVSSSWKCNSKLLEYTFNRPFFFTSIFCSHQDPIWPMMEFFMTCQIWTFHDTLSQWGQWEHSSSFSDAQPPPAGGSTDILITHSSASGLLLPPQRSYSAVWQVKTQVLLNLQGLVFFTLSSNESDPCWGSLYAGSPRGRKQEAEGIKW